MVAPALIGAVAQTGRGAALTVTTRGPRTLLIAVSLSRQRLRRGRVVHRGEIGNEKLYLIGK